MMMTDNEFYYWSTEEPHYDNNETMYDFLFYEMDETQYKTIYIDGTYAEIQEVDGLHMWEVHASGNGDSFNHKVQFVPMGMPK